MKPETLRKQNSKLRRVGFLFFAISKCGGGGCSISILRVEGLKEDMEHMGGKVKWGMKVTAY